ncbi:hypothetical protein ACVWY2_000504 [Bradyrhizobium sp. JR6.1]
MISKRARPFCTLQLAVVRRQQKRYGMPTFIEVKPRPTSPRRMSKKVRLRTQDHAKTRNTARPHYSHSIVPGGFDVTSYTTRFTPFTSLMMRVAVSPKNFMSNW